MKSFKNVIALSLLLVLLCSGFVFINRNVIFAESEDVKPERSDVITVADNLTVEEFEKFCKTASAQDIENFLKEKGLSADVMLKGKNDSGEEYQASLFISAISNTSDIEVIKTLISLGADVNVRDGRAFLYTTNPDVVALLLENGANLYAGDDSYEGNVFMRWLDYWNSPIWYEIHEEENTSKNTNETSSNSLENGIWNIHRTITYDISKEKQENILKIASLFLEHGYDVNHKDKYNGRTILMKAVPNLHWAMPEENLNLKASIISMLIKAGADVNAVDNSGQTVLTYSIDSHGVQGKAVDIEKTVSMLIEAGADINAKTEYHGLKGITALMKLFFGIYHQDEKIVSILLKAGADVNIRDENGNTALMYAIQNGSSLSNVKFSHVKLLLNAGADVKVRNNEGETALIKALNIGNSEIIEKLIEAGADKADVNIKVKDGKTVTQKAFQPVKEALENPASMDLNGLKSFIKLGQLIEFGGSLSGCDVNVKSKRGLPILTELILLSNQLNQLEDLDRKVMYFQFNFSIEDLQSAFSKIGKAMVEAGAYLEARDNDGETPLFIAIRIGALDIVNNLIQLGANVNSRNNNGYTALMIASVNKEAIKNPEILKTLLKSGANVDARDNEQGATALMLVCFSNPQTEIIRALLEAGANPNLTDNKGNNALVYLTSYVADKVEKGERISIDDAVFDMLRNAVSGNSQRVDEIHEPNENVEENYVSDNENIENQHGVVDTEQLNMRKNPSTNSSVLLRLHRGDVVIINYMIQDPYDYDAIVWYLATDMKTGTRGYVSAKYIRKTGKFNTSAEQADMLVGQGKVPMYVRDKGKFFFNSKMSDVLITANNVRLRSQPNTNANVVGRVDKDEATNIEYLGEWTHPNGDKWIVGLYIPIGYGEEKIVWVSSRYARPVTSQEYREYIAEELGYD